ncbi:MAG: amidohydrolase [Thermoproteota archaeon]
MDKYDRLLTNGAIYIEGGKIIDIGKTQDLEETYKADEVIDASNNVVMPGLINSHVHFTSVLIRGIEDDLSLEQWIGSDWTRQTQMLSKEEHAAAFKLVLVEMIKAGITCYNQSPTSAKMLREAYESGLRGFLALGEIRDLRGVLQSIRENYSDRLKLGLGPWWVPMIPRETLLETKEVAEKHNLKIHMHVAESKWEIQEVKRRYGCDGTIEYLDQLGLLSPRLIAAHCVQVSPREIDLMQRREVGVVHCPVSNAKLGDGIAPLTDFLKANIVVGLGSDGPSTNNCIDMFQEMKFACLLQRAIRSDPTVVKAKDVLKMATINGAKLIGMDNEIGSIEIGKKADIIIVDFQKPHLYPKTDIISHLVYSAKASDVDTVIVNGNVVMRNRRVLIMDEAQVLRKAQEIYEGLQLDKGKA